MHVTQARKYEYLKDVEEVPKKVLLLIDQTAVRWEIVDMIFDADRSTKGIWLRV